MLRTFFRRFCVLLMAFALIIGLPLYGMQCVVMMQQSAFAAIPDALPCSDCEYYGDEGKINTSICETTCAVMVATVPNVEVLNVTVSTILIANTMHHRVGFSTAPDPAPPRLPVLT